MEGGVAIKAEVDVVSTYLSFALAFTSSLRGGVGGARLIGRAVMVGRSVNSKVLRTEVRAPAEITDAHRLRASQHGSVPVACAGNVIEL